jgi:hypothetical protein
MPSATPVPRGPSVLALGSAAALLTGPGCPVCRYAAEASDRYLAWFALEAHADPVTITRLCASLGMCARHTRRLMSQPGAPARLTAVYRYLLQAAREQLAKRNSGLALCPACEHDEAAAGRALDMLLDGLSEPEVQERYLELGGLCGPHLRAAGLRGRRRAAAWLMRAAPTGTAGRRASIDVLAGAPDHDAAERATLRAALPREDRLLPGICPVCLTAARAEHAELARVAGTGSGRRPEDAWAVSHPGICLCAGHLRDAALLAGSGVPALLDWQAVCQAARLARLTRSPSWQRGGRPARWLRRVPATDDECPVCQAPEWAARQGLQRYRAGPSSRGGAQALCVRHVLGLRATDPAAGREAAAGAAQRACALIEELAEAFRKDTWTFRHESRGPEATAWRRAAAFLDGAVFGGGPPE